MASGSNLSTPMKRKSSNSSTYIHKKKLSKKSSEVKKRKKSKSRKSDKSKKLRRHRDVSISCSDDDSRSEDSLSSDSEDGYRHRKGRSGTREDVKGSKKRVKRSLSSTGDSRDPPSRKKRKRSKRSDDSKLKKKSRHGKSKKKRSKRDVSVDSISSDSRSCSTSHGGSSVEKIQIKRSRGRSKERDKGKKSLDQISNGRDRYNYRSRSCTPCSGASERNHYYSEEKLVSENYSKGLRSVLTIPDEYEEGIYQSKDGNKPEIIQAYDDCPSCKSNDSYDGGRMKESSHQAQALLEKKRRVHDAMVEDEGRNESSRQMSIPEKPLKVKVESTFTSNIKKTQIPVSSTTDDGIQCAKVTKVDHIVNMESTKVENKGEVSSGIVSSDVGDLESILRQKALENFQNFRKERQTQTLPPDQRGGTDVGVKQLSIAKVEPIKSSKDTDISVVGASNILALEKKSVGTAIVKGVSITNIPKDGVQISDGNFKRLESFHTTDTAHPSVHDRNRPLATYATEKKIISFGAIHNSSKRSFVYRRESPGDQSIKQASDSQDFSDVKSQQTNYIPRKLVSQPPKPVVESSGPREINKTLESRSAVSQETKNTAKKIVLEPTKDSQGNSDPREINKAPESVVFQEIRSIPNKIVPEPLKAALGTSHPHESNEAPDPVVSEATPVNGEHGLTESNAAKGGSEFEQKTMSVMRGGEMVQVSYKVYIPKKTPALARRLLRR
ncbi:hypothetical protein AQUCO_03600076v1 [Aquilegia coerulea]|uniref:Uncharacterized protein n=1 Tax=Aquilegia coerulea TaxID=218851 RepID=A0A2G5CV63_AQUCA|nr:hypothetical protein AQUCO_03600076v1 [Aquilegia coerulea]